MADYSTIELGADQPFDLNATLTCGQVFRWEQYNDWWYGVINGRVLKIYQKDNILLYAGVEEEVVRDFFQLDFDLNAVYESIDNDPYIKQAIENNRGLRLVKQDPWECLISHMIVTRIRVSKSKDRISRLCEMRGKKVEFDGRTFHTFPAPAEVTEAGLPALKACNLGYHALNIMLAAERVAADGKWIEKIRRLPYEEAVPEIMKFKGIKPRVVDWILLFGFQNYAVFPVDAHIRGIFMRYYMSGVIRKYSDSEKMDQDIRAEGRKRFGEYAGYAFEYLFSIRDEFEKI